MKGFLLTQISQIIFFFQYKKYNKETFFLHVWSLCEKGREVPGSTGVGACRGRWAVPVPAGAQSVSGAGAGLASNPSQHSCQLNTEWHGQGHPRRAAGQGDRDQAGSHPRHSLGKDGGWGSLPQHHSLAVAWNKRASPNFLIWTQITVEHYQDRFAAQMQKPWGRGGASRALTGRTGNVALAQGTGWWRYRLGFICSGLFPVVYARKSEVPVYLQTVFISVRYGFGFDFNKVCKCKCLGFSLICQINSSKPKIFTKLNYQFAYSWCVRWTAINHIYYLHNIFQTNDRERYHYYVYNPEEENRSQWGQTRSKLACVRSVFQELIFGTWKQLRVS